MLDQRQQDMEMRMDQWLHIREAGLGHNYQAIKVRSGNQALREELEQLQAISKKSEGLEVQNAMLVREKQEAEVVQLQAALAKAEEEGRALKEELARLQDN